MHMCAFPRKKRRFTLSRSQDHKNCCTYGFQPATERFNLEETPQLFWPPLPAEYVTGWTDTPEENWTYELVIHGCWVIATRQPVSHLRQPVSHGQPSWQGYQGLGPRVLRYAQRARAQFSVSGALRISTTRSWYQACIISNALANP